MKRFDEYNEEELLALSDDQVEMLIDLECAIAGVPLLPPEPIAPEEISTEPDTIVYEVSGFHYKSEEDARAVAEQINHSGPISVDYEWRSSTAMYHVVESRDLVASVNTKRAYTAALWKSIAVQVARYKGEKEAYEKAKKEYDSIAARREDHADKVHDALNAARDKKARELLARSRFDRYMTLAENNRATALRFFREAHPGDDLLILGDI